MMAQAGSRPSAAGVRAGRPSAISQHKADLQRRRDDGGEEHQHGDDLLPVMPRAARRRPITVVEAWRPTAVSPSMGTVFAIT